MNSAGGTLTVECTQTMAGREYMVIPVEIVVESVWYLLPAAWRWLRYISENLLLAFLPPSSYGPVSVASN